MKCCEIVMMSGARHLVLVIYHMVLAVETAARNEHHALLAPNQNNTTGSEKPSCFKYGKASIAIIKCHRLCQSCNGGVPIIGER